ncbi:MAG: transporter [Desulfobacteraceae bacterium]|nr:transporter [Desulfobacteraceae bacterium]
MKKLAIFSLLVLMVAVAPAISRADVTQSDRLLQRPEWDGAVMPSPWLDGGLTYEKWENDSYKADVWSLGGTFITSLKAVPQLELGTRLDIMNYDPNYSGSETGLSDIDAWGKYQVYKDSQVLVSAGLLVTLPTGSDEIVHPHASGEFNAEVFGAARYQANRLLALIGHLALRQNNDMDVKINNTTSRVDGKTQMAMGGGVIYQVNSQLNVQGELNFATEAYDDFENDIQLRGGLEYKLDRHLALRGGLSIGLADGAPDWALTFRCAYLF